MRLWELIARESIRDTIARYANAGDRLMVDEMAETFCEDGVLETGRDHSSWVGRTAIARRLGGDRGASTTEVRAGALAERTDGIYRVRQHLVTNIQFESLTREMAEVSSHFVVLTNVGLDHFGRYRDRLVPVDDRWLFSRRSVVRDWQRPDPGPVHLRSG